MEHEIFYPYPEPHPRHVGQKQSFPIPFLAFFPYLLPFGNIHTPVFEWHTEVPAPEWSRFASFLGLLNKLFTAQCRGPGRDKRRKWSPGEHVVYCKVQEGCCSSIDPRGKICGTSAASVSCVGRDNTLREL